MGFRGILCEVELIIVVRDIFFVKEIKGYFYIIYVFIKEFVRFIKMVKEWGVNVMVDICLYYISFIEEEVFGFNINVKVNFFLRI